MVEHRPVKKQINGELQCDKNKRHNSEGAWFQLKKSRKFQNKMVKEKTKKIRIIKNLNMNQLSI